MWRPCLRCWAGRDSASASGWQRFSNWSACAKRNSAVELPSELSGGQRQRVGVARGLAADPDLLLMDEPFGALDPGTRESIQDEFLRLNAELRKTVVFVTHDIAEAGRLAHDIVLLDHGRVVQQGTLRDLLIHPADERTQAFLGRQGTGLALNVLRLKHVVHDLPAAPASSSPLLLPADLPLGQALLALAGAGDGAVVALDGAHGPGLVRGGVAGTHCGRPRRRLPGPTLGPGPLTLPGLAIAAGDNHGCACLRHRAGQRLGTQPGLLLAANASVPVPDPARSLAWRCSSAFPPASCSRGPRLSGPAIAVLGLLQTVPALVLLGLFIPYLGIGPVPVLVAAVVYCLFPIVLNTFVGVTQVSPAVRDAARGMGMTSGQILWKVELPLAFPVVLVGVRTAAVYAGGMIVIGAYIGAGGLGDYIYNGMSRDDAGLIWLGAIPVLALTLALFWGLGAVAWLARKNSALGMSLGGGLILLLSGYAVYGLAAQPRKDVIVIGARDFTEGHILADILKQMLEAHTDQRVEVRYNLGGGVVVKAVKSGELDLYPEYTGNLLTSKEALDQPGPPTDRPSRAWSAGRCGGVSAWCCWNRSA